MQVTLDHTQDVAEHVRMFWFKPDKAPHYTAGQFIELRLPHDNPDERGEKRWFTLTSSPTEDLLAITTKLATKNGSSFKAALQRLKPGDRVHMSDPMGDFVLPKDISIPLVFVAGGIGITPMRSMVTWLSDTGERRQIHLLYAGSQLEDLPFRDLFESYGVELDILLKDPPANWKGQTGRLSAEKIIELTGKPAGKLIYVSGPEPMTEMLFKDLQEQGVESHQLVTDYFPGYPPV